MEKERVYLGSTCWASTILITFFFLFWLADKYLLDCYLFLIIKIYYIKIKITEMIKNIILQ